MVSGISGPGPLPLVYYDMFQQNRIGRESYERIKSVARSSR